MTTTNNNNNRSLTAVDQSLKDLRAQLKDIREHLDLLTAKTEKMHTQKQTLKKDLRQLVLVISAKRGLRERMGEVKERLAKEKEVRKKAVEEKEVKKEKRSLREEKRQRKDALEASRVGRKENLNV